MSFIRIKICMGKLQFLHQPRLQGAARFHPVSAMKEYQYACIVSVVGWYYFIYLYESHHAISCISVTNVLTHVLMGCVQLCLLVLKFVMTSAVTR